MGARRPKTSTKPVAPPGGVCARPLVEQLRDTTGAVRRIDHPRGAVRRLDLLRDEDHLPALESTLRSNAVRPGRR